MTNTDWPLPGAIGTDSADYDEARSVFNGMIDRRPKWIVPCRTEQDVASAIAYARDTGLPLAVRGGGHGFAGFGTCDGGLVIDLAPMHAIEIDPKTRIVRAGGGCTQGQIDEATHAHGLAVPAGVVSSTGISGLTLGGGHGYLSRQYGLTIDNLIEARVVLANGKSATASAHTEPDLFWALRGGGGNFGVVTELVFQVHPVSTVYGGPIFFDFAEAPGIMRSYGEFMRTAPRELYIYLSLDTMHSHGPFPDHLIGRKSCTLVICYDGPTAEGIEALRPLYEALPAPLLDLTGHMPFPALQSMFDPPTGVQIYTKGDFLGDLSEEAVAAHIDFASRAPTELCLTHFYPIDGAVQDVAPDATAWSVRNGRWSMLISAAAGGPQGTGGLSSWANEYWRAVHPFGLRGTGYVNFMMDGEGDERVRASYGGNYQRLVAGKRQYDPNNVFRLNQNIQPWVRRNGEGRCAKATPE